MVIKANGNGNSRALRQFRRPSHIDKYVTTLLQMADIDRNAASLLIRNNVHQLDGPKDTRHTLTIRYPRGVGSSNTVHAPSS